MGLLASWGYLTVIWCIAPPGFVRETHEIFLRRGDVGVTRVNTMVVRLLRVDQISPKSSMVVLIKQMLSLEQFPFWTEGLGEQLIKLYSFLNANTVGRDDRIIELRSFIKLVHDRVLGGFC